VDSSLSKSEYDYNNILDTILADFGWCYQLTKKANSVCLSVFLPKELKKSAMIIY